MNAAKVVPSKIQGQGCMKIDPLFGECVRQAGESANLHPHREILSFDVRRANPVEFWLSPLWDRYGVHHIGGRVAVFTVAGRCVNFYQLCEINASSKAVVNGIHIGLESVRCDLESPLCGFVNFLSEGYRVADCAPSKVPSQNQFFVSLDSNKAIRIPARHVSAGVVLFLAADESPKFIALDIADCNVADTAFQQPFALFPYQSEQGKNSCMVNAGDSLYRADRASFAKKFDCLSSLFDGCVHAAKRRGMTFCEGLATLITAETLKSVPVLSKFLAAGIAVVTGHCGLPFCGSKPIMKFGSAFAACSATADLAPPSAPTDGGASYLSGVESEGSALCASEYFPSVRQPLQNRVDERQRILDASEIVSPRREDIPNFYGAQGLTGTAIKDSTNKVRPRYFSLYLLAQSVLKANLRGLQLRDFSVKLCSLLQLYCDLTSNVFQSLLQFLGHSAPSQYPSTIHIWSIHVKYYFRGA